MKLPREIVPAEAQIVRRIFREYLAGKSFCTIAFGLNAESIAARKKGYWSGNVVRNILRNPTFCGKVHHNTVGSGRKKLLPEEQWVIVQGKHQPIVSEEEWQEAQAIRKRKHLIGRAAGSPLLLSGLLRCGHCGFSMCKDGSWGGGYYICGQYKTTHRCQRNSYLRTRLEKDVMAYVFGLIRSEDVFDAVKTQQQAQEANETVREAECLQTHLSGLPDRKRRIFELYEQGDISRDEFLTRKAEHADEERRCDEILREKRELLARLTSEKINRQVFQRTLWNLEQRWDQQTLTRQKCLLGGLIERIEIVGGVFNAKLRLTNK